MLDNPSLMIDPINDVMLSLHSLCQHRRCSLHSPAQRFPTNPILPTFSLRCDIRFRQSFFKSLHVARYTDNYGASIFDGLVYLCIVDKSSSPQGPLARRWNPEYMLIFHESTNIIYLWIHETSKIYVFCGFMYLSIYVHFCVCIFHTTGLGQ